MCIYILICKFLRVYVCTHIYIYTYIHIYVYIYICMYIYIYKYVYIYKHQPKSHELQKRTNFAISSKNTNFTNYTTAQTRSQIARTLPSKISRTLSYQCKNSSAFSSNVRTLSLVPLVVCGSKCEIFFLNCCGGGDI